MEAGGHIGPVSTSVLAQEILPQIREVPVFVAGGIGRGEAIARLPARWAPPAASSAPASSARRNRSPIPQFKQAFIRASARDAVPSVQIDPRFPVIPGARAGQSTARERFVEIAARGDRPRSTRRDRPEGGAARDRAFLGRRAAPRGDRRRRRERLADGRPERRHGDARAADARRSSTSWSTRRSPRLRREQQSAAEAASGAMQYGQTVLVLRRPPAAPPSRDVMAGERQRADAARPDRLASSPRTW